MDERKFRGLLHDAIGEAPIPPDLESAARRVLTNPVRRGPSRLVQVFAAVASILLLASVVGYNLLSHYRPGPDRPAPASSSAVTPTPTLPPIASPSPSAGQACSADQLSVVSGGTQGAAGHGFLRLILTNSSAVPCTISGFPTAQLLSADHAPVPTRVVNQGGQLSNTPPPASFLLSPGQKSEFQLSWGDVPVGNETCRNASIVDLGPPGQAPSPNLSLTSLSILICNSGEVDVSALLPSS